jgi:hypothetical protein
MLDYEEIPGSLGTSSVLMDSRGHRINFSIDGTPGYVEINKDGWLGFTYKCVVDGTELQETTHTVSPAQGEKLYDIKISKYSFSSDWSEGEITWYQIDVVRLGDKVATTVHRRFRDFVDLQVEVKRRLKGHQLYNDIPELPDKHIKAITDHNNSGFLDQRQAELNQFLQRLFDFPHVPQMTCSKAFIGLMEQVRETSIVFPQATLGLSLVPSQVPGETHLLPYNLHIHKCGPHLTHIPQCVFTITGTPAVVGIIQRPESCPGLQAGDVISKINGKAIGNLGFAGVVNCIKQLNRPIVVHFVQALGDLSLVTLPNQTPAYNPPPVPRFDAPLLNTATTTTTTAGPTLIHHSTTEGELSDNGVPVEAST